jgi:hypothetical protein
MNQMKLEFLAEEQEVVKKANQPIRARHEFTIYEPFRLLWPTDGNCRR